MKYCNECGVFVNDKLSRCPLCGSHVSDKTESFELYEERVQPYIDYPSVSLKNNDSTNFLRKKSLLLIAAVTLICIWINVFITPDSVWSCYTTLSMLLLYFGIIRPVFGKARLYLLLPLYGFLTVLFGCLFDLIHSYSIYGSFISFGISVEFVVPGIILALIVACDIFAVADRSKYMYYIVSLIILTVLALVPQIFVWSITDRKLADWLSFSVMSFALLNIAVFSVVYWRKMKEEVQRKFFI